MVIDISCKTTQASRTRSRLRKRKGGSNTAASLRARPPQPRAVQSTHVIAAGAEMNTYVEISLFECSVRRCSGSVREAAAGTRVLVKLKQRAMTDKTNTQSNNFTGDSRARRKEPGSGQSVRVSFSPSTTGLRLCLL